MKVTKPTIALLGLLAAGTVVTAQQAKPAQDPAGAPTAATAAKVVPGPELRFTVSGLTQENASKVKESLTTLSFQSYVCEACKYEQSTAGKCTPCNTELKAVKKPLLAAVMPSATDSSITLTMAAGTPTRFSEIEGALKRNAINIDYAKFPIAGQSHLVIRGATADRVAEVEKALIDAKLFDEVKATFDAKTSEIHVAVRAGAAPPTRAKVASTIEGLKLTFADVIWQAEPKKA